MSIKYNLYINDHKHNVKSAHSWLKWNLPDLTKGTLCDDYIEDHDDSKWSADEYEAYDEYFYGNKTEEVKTEFNRAWLHHIHTNPHHWQHWLLVNDDPKKGLIPIEMDYEYVIEMICDWWSFSWKTGNLYEIFDWYDKHKSYMILHANTRKIVEDILSKIKEVLDNEKK